VYQSVTLVCFHCKCEFTVDLIQLEARPERVCPNCGQRFDFVGIGLLAEGLRKLQEASQSVTFRLPEAQEYRQLRRTIASVVAAAKETL